MTELQLKVIEELETNYGWSNIADDSSIGMELLKDTVNATQTVVKNLTIPDVSICVCGTEEHTESKKRSDGMVYCGKCNKPY